MKKLFVLALCCYGLFFAQLEFSAAAPLTTKNVSIKDIRLVGLNKVDGESVLVGMKISKGMTPNAETIDAEIKRIYRLGFFDQVSGAVDQVGNFIVTLVEKPSIRRILLEGNDVVNDETLKEKLLIPTRRFLDRKQIKAGVAEAMKYYEGLGRAGTTIEVEEQVVGENEVDLKYIVKEVDKKVIREIAFEGNRAFTSDELEDEIDTGTHSWWISWLSGSGILKQEKLDNDVKKLARFYLNQGYAEVSVGEPRISELENGIKLTFPITEGELFTFGEITAQGDLVDGSQEQTLTGTKALSGETFSVDKLNQDTFTVSEKFTDIGYAFANVEPDTKIIRETRRVDVTYQISKGNLITVNRVNVAGNDKTADNVVRRQLKIADRDLYSSSKVKRSEELMRRTGYFTEASITPQSIPNKDEVDLNVLVKEGQTGSFSVGAGISSGEGFIFNTRFSETNMFGSGNSLTLNSDLGDRNENYTISYDNPRINDTYLSGGLDIFSANRRYDTFERRQTGGSVTLGYPLAFLGSEAKDEIRFSTTYQLAKIKIHQIEEDAPSLVKDAEGETLLSSITPKLLRNTIDNPLNPASGSRQLLQVEYAGLGGDEEFWLGQASNTIYYPLIDTAIGPIVFSQRTRFDYGKAYGDSDRLSLFRRFFAGGINSVRGFEARKLGPRDTNGEFYGGAKQLIANFEMLFPLAAEVGIKALAFYDIGNAFDDDENLEVSELRQAVGGGIRWTSPIGPIRLEFGHPLDRKEGDRNFVPYFSFGAPF
ncbi:outer membrane protein assembly factor BamA [bacterium]|nr:outer membrane protein assembly factor BamA [bacterium]